MSRLRLQRSDWTLVSQNNSLKHSLHKLIKCFNVVNGKLTIYFVIKLEVQFKVPMDHTQYGLYTQQLFNNRTIVPVGFTFYAHEIEDRGHIVFVLFVIRSFCNLSETLILLITFQS